MSYETDLEEEIKELRYTISTKNDMIRELREELSKSENKLSSAEYKINTELNPRIEREKRSYDSYITSPEAHMSEEDSTCLHFCETGQCGSDCPQFGYIPECTENLSNSELLKEYIINDSIEQIILDRGLWFKKLKVDWVEDSKIIEEDCKSIKSSRKIRLNRLISNIKIRE